MAVKVQGTESFFLLPLVFAVVTLLFTLLGQNLGRLLAAVQPPLTAYTIDVAGSIAGSALFALISFLGAPPGVWFAIAALACWRCRSGAAWCAWLNAIILLGMVVWVSLLGSRSLLVALLSHRRAAARRGNATPSSSTTSGTRRWRPTPCA